ncbi:ATP-binding protein [Peribacillus frigoritolerans]|uniref:ATP-binding protein n=1 Tax=Peribacillus frigoritolerans TaxID=450367 RepID=UPI0010598E55|nr:ATP-binding protein [Peribacillus frigoritolerans]TDL82534.1 PAS domain S-box protein [Peribacillus frigoritolerans]
MSKKKKVLYIYFFISMIWIFGTDHLIAVLDYDIYTFILISKFKAIVFIIATSIFIYYLINENEQFKELEREKEKLLSLINSMVDFVNFKDGQGRWIEVNTFGLNLFQLQGVEYKGKSDRELAEYTDFYKEALLFCEKSDEITWQGGTVSRCEEIIPLPDGSFKTFDTIKVPLYNDDGSRKALVVIGRDITQMKEAEDRLQKAEKLSVVGGLAASVAHEIRNPLTSLKGFVQLMNKNDSVNKMYYEIMESELDRINEIVGELLVLAKPQNIHFKKTNLNQLMCNVISLLESQANMYGVNIEFEHAAGMPDIDCEPNQLKQVFINVIKNSIEAGSTTIEIKVSHNQEHAFVMIADDGDGIEDERLKRLGEPFYSVKEKGTGLGLTVSYRIIESHNGKISFSSKVGEGTAVEIEIPMKRA